MKPRLSLQEHGSLGSIGHGTVLLESPKAHGRIPVTRGTREPGVLPCFYLGKVGLNKVREVTKAQEDGQKFWEGGNELAEVH